MSEQFSGKVDILDNTSKTTIRLDGDTGDISAGGGISGKDGNIKLRDSSGNDKIWLMGEAGDIITNGNLFAGPLHAAGVRTFSFFGSTGDIQIHSRIGSSLYKVMQFLVQNSTLSIGCQGRSGKIALDSGAGHDVIQLIGYTCTANIGAMGRTGHVPVPLRLILLVPSPF